MKYKAYRDEEAVLFEIEAKIGGVENPVLLYDGGQHAFLARDQDQLVILDWLHENIQGKPLMQTKKVLIVEVRQNGELRRSYEAAIQHVEDLSSLAKNLITPEEMAERMLQDGSSGCFYPHEVDVPITMAVPSRSKFNDQVRARIDYNPFFTPYPSASVAKTLDRLGH
jgi:hypothetical protein